MKKRSTAPLLACLAALMASLPSAASAAEGDGRCGLWLDVYRGEPLAYEDVLEDLRSARVIYLGEIHSIRRHQQMQARILGDLAEREVPLVLGLEPLESFHQPALDRYVAGEIGFEALAKATDWAERWPSYEQYRQTMEIARRRQIPILGLNARAETIRQIARGGGVDRLPPEARQELPADLHLEEPLYEKLLGMELMVHAAATPERLRPMIEAQMARDAMMASVLAAFLQSPEGRSRTAVVLCGAGHVSYGLGTASRVRRRMPGVEDRIVLFSESGDLELSPQEKAMAREIQITHRQLREIDRPIADFLHVTSLRPQASE